MRVIGMVGLARRVRKKLQWEP
jgi:hypothetical protein